MTWKWVLVVVSIPVAAALVVVLVGYLLPKDHVARGETTIAAPLERVADLVRDVENQTNWRGNVSNITILNSGPHRVRYIEHSGEDAITFEFEEVTPNSQFRSRIVDPNLPFGGEWTIILEPAGSSVRVKIEERGTVTNIIYRFFSKFLVGHDATINAYLRDLGAAAANSYGGQGR
jgi:uncharacterized protein YndB with AHSA1/START domain